MSVATRFFRPCQGLAFFSSRTRGLRPPCYRLSPLPGNAVKDFTRRFCIQIASVVVSPPGRVGGLLDRRAASCLGLADGSEPSWNSYVGSRRSRPCRAGSPGLCPGPASHADSSDILEALASCWQGCVCSDHTSVPSCFSFSRLDPHESPIAPSGPTIRQLPSP